MCTNHPNFRAGGVAILLRDSVTPGCEITSLELAPGPVLAVELVHGQQCRFVVSVHFSPSDELSWAQLATLISDNVEARRDQVGFVLGDFCLASEDVLEVVSLQPLGVPGA